MKARISIKHLAILALMTAAVVIVPVSLAGSGGPNEGAPIKMPIQETRPVNLVQPIPIIDPTTGKQLVDPATGKPVMTSHGTAKFTLTLGEAPAKQAPFSASFSPQTAPHGCHEAHGHVTYSFLGATEFQYDLVVDWCFSNWKITLVYNHNAYSSAACCGWTFKGNQYNNLVPDHPAGQSSFIAKARGTYEFCIWIACVNTLNPWILLQMNGAGNITDYEWGGV